MEGFDIGISFTTKNSDDIVSIKFLLEGADDLKEVK